MTIGERIKEKRIERGLSVDALAEKLGKNLATVYRYESNHIENMPLSVLEPIANALNVTPSYLMGWADSATDATTGDVFTASTDNPAYKAAATLYNDMNRVNNDPLAVEMVPVLGSVAAGFNAIAYENPSEHYPAPAYMITEDTPHFYLTVGGDSMSPEINDGDLILVRKQNTVDNGDVAVALIDKHEGVVKRVFYDENRIELISANPYYPPRVFEGPDVMRVGITGVVVSSVRKYK